MQKCESEILPDCTYKNRLGQKEELDKIVAHRKCSDPFMAKYTITLNSVT